MVENVYGFLDYPNGATWLSSRMEKIGYFGQILCFPDQAIGAPHKRERIFALYCRDEFLSNSNSQLRYLGEFATHKISTNSYTWHLARTFRGSIRNSTRGLWAWTRTQIC
ncbi:MAG: DNA cytosine methyltransferase [Quinella sp. 1Q5]|nr:DNA cytosine methyltransferase [Quinella sp. 1Q5]